MSTASEGIPTDQPPRTGHHPSALAILTATAVGGVIATRLGKTPLVLAAGAAAYALLKQKSPVTSQPISAPLPEPVALPSENPPQDQVEQWLARQMDRETQLPLAEIPAPEDDYHPQPFLADDVEEPESLSLSHETFVQLTEPVVRKEAPPREEVVAQQKPESLSFSPTEFASGLGSAWLLGVEPIPSVSDGSASPGSVSRMFSAEPGPEEEPSPSPPSFAVPTFQGAAFPDEIEVPMPAELEASESPAPVLHLTPTLEGSVSFPAAPAESAPGPDVIPPASLFTPAGSQCIPPASVLMPQSAEPAAMVELSAAEAAEPPADTPEIPVQLATPGEASFDPPPLENLPENPWMPPVELTAPPAPAAPAPAPSAPSGPVVEAEIVLRPRAPTQNSVLPKSKSISPRFAKNTPPEEPPQSAPPAEDGGEKSLPPAPVQTPREQRARPTWRSWWRGE